MTAWAGSRHGCGARGSTSPPATGVDRTDTVAVEEPLEIRVGDEPLTTTMRTPGDDFDLAIGHLLTEAMLHSADEVGTLMHCTDLDEDGSPTFNVVDVTLAPGRCCTGRPASAPRR